MAEPASTRCPQCGKEIAGGFGSCVYCGWAAPVSEENDRLEAYWYPAMWAMAFLLIPVGIIVGWRASTVWRTRYPRKARAMARLNLTAHLVVLVVVIILSVVLYRYFRATYDSLTCGLD
ncbi:MAG: hypothetical protein ACRD2L_21460 [Terriglobia bacterium]